MITPIACERLISAESTKPITIMSVADELWISMVTRIPTRIAVMRFPATFSNIVFSLSPAAFFSPVDMMDMP